MANMFEKYVADREADKKALKLMAAERETTIAAIIHEWIAERIEEVDE